MTTNFLLKLEHLPNSLPIEGAVRIELVEGVPIFRASSLVQERIETLIARQRKTLSQQFPEECDRTLSLLLQRELIEEAEDGYRFQVELICRWFAQ